MGKTVPTAWMVRTAHLGFEETQVLIEALWRSLRHQWLYLHSLESFRQLEQLIDFYVREHNTQMPHHAFGGTRSTLLKPMVSAIASRRPGIRLAAREWKRIEVNPVPLAHHRLDDL